MKWAAFFKNVASAEKAEVLLSRRMTTILCVRRDGRTVLGGDGQVTLDKTVMKGNARKVRRLGEGSVIAGFAGGTADAFTLFERFDAKLKEHQKNLARACVELGKDWRTDRFLRRLEALLIVADKEKTFILSGAGDVIEPDFGIAAVGERRPIRPGSGAGAHRELEPVGQGDRRALTRHRRRHLHLHQHQHRAARSSDALVRCFRGKSSTSSIATSSGRGPPSARWPSRCATGGGASRCLPS